MTAPRSSKEAIQQGISTGIHGLASGIAQGMISRNEEAKRKNMAERLSKASPIEKAKIYSEMDPKLGFEYEKELRKSEKQSMLQDLLSKVQQRAGGGQGMTPQDMLQQSPYMNQMQGTVAPGQTPQEMNIQDQEMGGMSVRPEEILAASALDPAVGRSLGDIAKMEQRDKQFKEKQRQTLFKEKLAIDKKSDDYYKTLEGEGKVAKSRLHAFGVMKKDISSGKVNPKNFKGLVRTAFKGSRWEQYFKNPEESRFEAAALESYEGMKDIFGTRLSDADLKQASGKIPSIDKAPEANLAIIEYNEFKDKMKLEALKVGDQIIEENGGFKPIDFSKQVRSRMEQMHGEEAQQITRRAAYDGANGPRFDPSNPEHHNRRMQILEQVGGDRQKANAILAQEFAR